MNYIFGLQTSRPWLFILRVWLLVPGGVAVSLGWLAVAAAAQSGRQDENWVNVLQKDPRLKPAMSFRFAQRTAWKLVFDEIKKATGVSLTLARETELADATFGRMTYYNVPAWTVMRQIAASEVQNGRWEKSDDGYVLHGEPMPRGLYIDGPEAEKARLEEKEASRKQLAASIKAAEDFKKMHPLSVDRKLWVKLTVVEKKADLAELINRLEKKTGLRFTLADNLANHNPALGQFNVKDAFAFHFMGTIATTELDDGRWVKTEDGYRLEGVSRSQRTPPTPPPSTFPWGWTAIGLALTLIATGMFVIYRGRGKKSAVKPTNA